MENPVVLDLVEHQVNYQRAPDGMGRISPCGKYCWIDIPKCASTTIKHELDRLKWTQIVCSRDSLPNNLHYFAVVRDPIDRWYSGVCEYIWQAYRRSSSSESFSSYVDQTLTNFSTELLFDAMVFDLHTIHQSYFLSGIDLSKTTLFRFGDSLNTSLTTWFDENQLAHNWARAGHKYPSGAEKIFLREFLLRLPNHPQHHQRVTTWFSYELGIFENLKYYDKSES